MTTVAPQTPLDSSDGIAELFTNTLQAKRNSQIEDQEEFKDDKENDYRSRPSTKSGKSRPQTAGDIGRRPLNSRSQSPLPRGSRNLTSSGSRRAPRLPSRPQTALGTRTLPRVLAHAVPSSELCTIIPGRLSIAIHLSHTHTSDRQTRATTRHFFSTDLQDCEHVNVGVIVQFCRMIKGKLNDPRLSHLHVIYYTGPWEKSRFHLAFLMAAYMILEHNYSVEDAVKPFENSRAFRLGTISRLDVIPEGYELDLTDCLRGLIKAKSLGWIGTQDFDVMEYDANEQSRNLHQVCKRMFIFTGPVDEELKHCRFHYGFNNGSYLFGPDKYIEFFKEKGVTTVVRLNDPEAYDKTEFTSKGIKVADFFFDESSNPANHLVRRFLKLCVQEKGAIAVHSKFGLGRAGTLVAVWLMEMHGFSAAEAMGWLRIVRPGCVIGIQQRWIFHTDDVQNRGWRFFQDTSAGANEFQKMRRTPTVEERVAAFSRQKKGKLKAVVTGITAAHRFSKSNIGFARPRGSSIGIG